jgi:hypothetical protein
MSAFDSASRALFKTLSQAAGVNVSYKRSGGNTISLRAVQGQTRFNQTSAIDGETLYMESNDFIFLTSDLLDGSNTFLPSRGDSITYNGVTYSVLADGGDAMYKYTDQSKKTIRVHCKGVG